MLLSFVFPLPFTEPHKAKILLNRSLKSDDKSRQISEIKTFVFRNLFFFLYVTYPSTCAQTARVFPTACQKLCRDDREEMCLNYMKADYSIKCKGTNYNHWLIMAYISLQSTSLPSRSSHSLLSGGSKEQW